MGTINVSSWKGREAIRLSNGVAEMVVLAGGGHLASFRLLEVSAAQAVNGLWESGWATVEPNAEEELPPIYGTEDVRRFLASYTGHALCLDYFGDASPEQRAAGLSLHGEAAICRWKLKEQEQGLTARAVWEVSLPIAGLQLEREIRLENGQSIAYLRETVVNTRKTPHSFDWVQHVTLGPPLLAYGESTLRVSAGRGMTAPAGYDDCSMVQSGQEFDWPYAPGFGNTRPVDLREPFATEGKGLIAGLQMDPGSEVEYLIAVNWNLRAGIGYLFRRRDFPWITVWEENRARKDPPWNGTTRARGMEFGTLPLPRGCGEVLRDRRFHDTPQEQTLAGGARKTAQYAAFLFQVPDGVSSIEQAEPTKDAVMLRDKNGYEVVSLPARGCEEHLMQEE